MGKTWILHTETKGTGANMVPLDRVTKRRSTPEPLVVPPKPRPRASEPPKPRARHRFRVVDVMTRETLADDVGARDVTDLLKDIRSIVDINVYVWQDHRQRWRPLTFNEQHALWELAGR